MLRPAWVGWVLLAVLSTAAASARKPRVPSDLHYEARYREVLELFARAESEAATRALARLDTDVLGRELREPFRALEREKLRVAKDLVAHEPETALALGVLHDRAYSGHLAAGRYHLAAHEREVTEAMAGFLVRHGVVSSRGLAALLMVSLGGRAHQAHQWSTAEALYSDALLLDSSIGAAWLGLATIQEKRGSYRSAVASLRALEGLPDPPHQAGLRLGLNLLRVGEPDEARRILERVARAPSVPSWIRAVAFQELARDLLARGGSRGVVDLLREARAEIPCDVTLAVLLAYVEERAGVPSSAETPLAPECAGAGLSARSRYNRFPGEIFVELEEDLDEAVAAVLPRLEEALGKRRRFPW